MTAAVIGALLPHVTDKVRAAIFGVSVSTAKRYRRSGVPESKLRDHADRLQALLEHRLAELALAEKALAELRSANAAAFLDARRAVMRGLGVAPEQGNEVLRKEGGGGGAP